MPPSHAVARMHPAPASQPDAGALVPHTGRPRPHCSIASLAAGALGLLGAALAACTDAPLAPAARGLRANAAPLAVARLVVTALGQNLCVDIQGAGAAPGDPGKPATIYSCHGGDNQQLTFQPTGELTLYGGTMCLDIQGAQANDGDAVQMWTCHGGANQQWRYVSDGLSGSGTIVGQNGKCLEVPDLSTTPGTPLRVWTCNGSQNQQWALRSLSASVAPIGGSAELPRTYLDTRLPAVTGRTLTVAAGGDLQAALDSAHSGDQIVLAAGATFVGNFVLPVKPGMTGGQWITVRTSGSLPAAGTRVGPANAAQMAAILTPSADPAIATTPGTQGWRLIGLEVGATSQAASVYGLVYSLVAFGSAGADQQAAAQIPSRLVLDRSYVHGATSMPLKRCVELNSAASAVVDSYLADCHLKGYDSQAIMGWNGPGPYRIVNNYLEGAGEVIMFGGADPSISGNVPADIEIRRNHVTRPTSWREVWTVKNLLELKMGQRVLVEGNVLENNWRDAQDGAAVVFNSNNQDGGCTWCITSDVTFRYNVVRNTHWGVTVAAHGSNGDVHPSQAMRRVTIAHNLVLGVAEEGGRMFEPTGGIDGLTIVNNSAIGGSHDVLILPDNPVEPLPTFLYRNNVTGGDLPFCADEGHGCGTQMLAYMGIPTDHVAGNVFLNTSRGDLIPTGNTYGPASGAGFADYAGGDLTLTPASPYRTAGTGGTRPGADMAALKAATNGVVR